MNNIIFTVKSDVKKWKGILLLNSELGNYTHLLHPSIKIEEGEIIDFFCPVCGADLTATGINISLARIIMTDKDSKEFDVYFSKICGEHSTFLIQKDNIIERYGKESSSYVNYFMSRLKK
jgi:hypothetical protein